MRPVLLIPVLVAGCGSLTPSMRYAASDDRAQIPLAVDVDVRVAPVTERAPFGAGDEVLLAASLRESLTEDLAAHGPFRPVTHGDVRLVIDIDGYTIGAPNRVPYVVVGAATLGFGFVLGPVVGAPMAGRETQISGRAALVHSSGRVLAEAHGAAVATVWTGLYYGRKVGLGPAARLLMGDLLEKLAVQRDQVFADLATARTSLASDHTRARRILAVLDLAGEGLDPAVAEELTAYLAAQLASRGRYRLVPRSTVRDELRQTKAGSLEPCVDEACQIELGKAVAAEKTLAPRLLRVGETCALTATLFDLRTETAERAAASRSRCDASALLASVDALAAQLD